MLDLKPNIGVGVGDLQIAAVRETQRIMREAGGDPQIAMELVLARLYNLDLISKSELRSLVRISGLGFDTEKGDTPPEVAYNEVRRIYHEMLAEGQASPTALALASGAAGSYFTVEDVDGQPTVVAKKASDSRKWTNRFGTLGAAVGAVWGPAGAAIGTAIGYIVGGVLDDKEDKENKKDKEDTKHK